MDRIILMSLVITLTLAFPIVSEAKVYKWRDENGTLIFTDDITKVPKSKRPVSRQTPASKDPSQTNKSKQEKQVPINKKRPKSPPFSGDNFDPTIEDGLQELGNALADGMGKGLEKLGEEMGKAFEGLGELMVIALENQPDTEKKTFTNKEEQVKHETQQVLLGMFLMCQFQFIVGKSETCSKDGLNIKPPDGWKIDEGSEMKKKLEEYNIDIDPKKNTRQDLLIKANHKKIGQVWEITHEGKKSIKESSL